MKQLTILIDGPQLVIRWNGNELKISRHLFPIVPNAVGLRNPVATGDVPIGACCPNHVLAHTNIFHSCSRNHNPRRTNGETGREFITCIYVIAVIHCPDHPVLGAHSHFGKPTTTQRFSFHGKPGLRHARLVLFAANTQPDLPALVNCPGAQSSTTQVHYFANTKRFKLHVHPAVPFWTKVGDSCTLNHLIVRINESNHKRIRFREWLHDTGAHVKPPTHFTLSRKSEIGMVLFFYDLYMEKYQTSMIFFFFATAWEICQTNLKSDSGLNIVSGSAA